jgi:TatD DNase family protein
MKDENSNDGCLIDAHFHFDLFNDPAEVLAEIEARRVRTIAVTNAPSVFHHTLNFSRRSRYLIPAVGLHPELVATHGREVDSMWPLLDQTRFVGEVGLDYVTTDRENRATQRDVFSKIVERCAAYGDRVLTIHSRRSAPDIIAIVGSDYPGRIILHWFSGSRRDLDRALASGFYFSVGPAMVRSKNGISLLSAMPRDRVLTETDGPFVQTGGRPARPQDVASVVEAISEVWDVSSDEARATISRNFDALVSRGDPPSTVQS